jgi:hypothetical protein
MRRFNACLMLVPAALGVVSGPLSAQTPAPVRVTKGPVTVTCGNGAATVQGRGVGLTFGKDLVFAARTVPRALAEAGFELIPGIPAVYHTRPLLEWPDTVAADPYRAFAYPGVVASLILANSRSDSVLVGGIVEALCASSPGAPDSTVSVALDLAAARLQQVLEQRRPRR